jgi:hypothetical protein
MTELFRRLQLTRFAALGSLSPTARRRGPRPLPNPPPRAQDGMGRGWMGKGYAGMPIDG